MNLSKRLTFTFVSLMTIPVVLAIASCIFLIVYDNAQISRQLVVESIWILIVVLVAFDIMLTTWVNKGVFLHIKELNKAMQDIAEGNFDHALDSESVDGEIAELFESYEDMRLKLKESGEDRIKAESMNRELISNITHDLKTPITSIKGYAEGILDGVADTDEKKQRYIRTIYDKTKDLDRLLNELTYYSSIDSNRIPYTFHRINVGEFFSDCIEEVGMDLGNRNIKLDFENLLEPGTRIIADPIQLRKVIDNIIGNSIKYMDKPDGQIEIRLLDAVDSVRVEIEDNGKGIAAKDLGNIFERFYRTDASRNSSQGGSGIGLSIVKKIIEDHGGYIWATSKEGEGTCMHFVIRKYTEDKVKRDTEETELD
ncbi:MAG: HAMP domain-containing histidine kinase [Lachnospiraceae bacterium]|nr:HAMP domain-containing histidine kinase [Lachnospiraceae bacterium]